MSFINITGNILIRDGKLSSEAKIKLDKRSRQLIIYPTFVKKVEKYGFRGYLTVDVNENNITMLANGIAYLFETSTEKPVYLKEEYVNIPVVNPQKNQGRKVGVKTKV